MDDDEDQRSHIRQRAETDHTIRSLVTLIGTGHLIPVQVFGAMDDEWGYGLMDRCSTHAPGGSDCNRAAFFLLRPSDDLMESDAVRAALVAVLESPDENLWEENEQRGHVVRLGTNSEHHRRPEDGTGDPA